MHRINTVKGLVDTPGEFGVEIDVRGYGTKMLLTHDPVDENLKYDQLDDYLSHYDHRFIIFNLKEAGYEQRVIDLAEKYGIVDYFLLDVEFPFLYNATRKKAFRRIAVRYSEAEPIEFALAQKSAGKPLVDWVWVDTNTVLPLDGTIMKKLAGFKTCLVSPERWGRPGDIEKYGKAMVQDDVRLDAIMTSPEYVQAWRNTYR